MKVILYMAMTLNGMIAKENDETPWLDAEWESYKKIVKMTGNIIIGKRTYNIMKKGREFKDLKNPLTIIVTTKPLKNQDNFIFVKSPREAIKAVESKGFSECLVVGGGKLNASFMKEKLIDEIIINLEPFIFGEGINLFTGLDFEANLELIGKSELSKNELQLRYKVKK